MSIPNYKITYRVSDDVFSDITTRAESLPDAQQVQASSHRYNILVDALYCDICDVKTTCEKSMLSHFKSKKHEKMLRFFVNEKNLYDHNYFVNRSILLHEDVELKKQGIFRCWPCAIDFGNQLTQNEHFKCDEHRKKINIIRSKIC